MKADTVKFFEFLEQKKTIFNIPVSTFAVEKVE